MDVVFNTILINGFIAIFFALWQFFDVSILEAIYRKPLEDIGNLTLAIGYRLASTMINPINFGAFLVIFYLVVHYLYEVRKIGFFIYGCLTFVILLMIVGSLSRLALLAFLAVLSFLHFYKAPFYRIFIASLIFIVVLFVAIAFDFGSITSRFEELFLLTTYTENERIQNWLFAIFHLESYQYIWGRGLGASSPDSSVVFSTSAIMIENAFLSVFIQYGLIGLISVILILMRFFYVGFSLSYLNPPLGKFVIGFLVFFVVLSLGNDFLRISPFVYYFWFFYSYFEVLYAKQGGYVYHAK